MASSEEVSSARSAAAAASQASRQSASVVGSGGCDAISPASVRPPAFDESAGAAVAGDASPVLAVPYPTAECCSQLLGHFPGRLGLFVAGRPGNYAFRSNRASIELAVHHLGYKVHDLQQQPDSSRRCPAGEAPDDPPEESVATDSTGAAAVEKAKDDAAAEAAETAEAAAAKKLADALDAESEASRLSFVFLKPRQLPWDRLANCVTFEPYHRPSLFAADKWNMAQILRRRSQLPSMRLVDANGDVFDDRRFTLYTANAGRGQKLLLGYLDANPGAYVLKRTNSSQGIGIHMYQAQRPNTVARLQRCAGGAKARLSHFVLQKYIERPLLIDKRKFDLRCYLLVISCTCPQRPGERGYFAFCHPGYVKLSSRAYAQASRDPRVHFTNQWVQRRRQAQYERVKEATTWLPDELEDYLSRRGRTEAGWCRRRMYQQVRAVAGYLAAACRPYLESRRPGCVFRVYGPDLIVDEALRLQLLEFNCFPCYAKNTVALAASVGGMWREAVAVATEAALRFRDRRPIGCSARGHRWRLDTGVNFRLVHSSERPEVLADLVRGCYP